MAAWAVPTLMQEDVDARLIGQHDVQQTVPGDFRDDELGSNSRITTDNDLVVYEPGRRLFGALDLDPALTTTSSPPGSLPLWV